MSIRGITRTFGVCYQTVMRWVGKKAESFPAFVDTLLPAKNGDVLELDELWSFVSAKACQLWLWVALCRRTRQIRGLDLGRPQPAKCGGPAILAGPGLPGDAPPAATSGSPTPRRFPSTPTAAAASTRAKPTTLSVGLAPCTLEPAAWYVGPTPSQKRREPPRRHPPLPHQLQLGHSTESNGQVITTTFTAVIVCAVVGK